MPTDGDIDYRRLFERAPTSYLVLDASLTILAANDAYLDSVHRTRDQLIGRHISDVFPPGDSGRAAVEALRTSLGRVLATRGADAMDIVRYDMPAADGAQERYWSPVSVPVLDSDGRVSLILHRADDVTEFVEDEDSASDELEGAHLRLLKHAQQLREANRSLRRASASLARIAAQQATVARLGQDAVAAADPQALLQAAAAAVSTLPEMPTCEVIEQHADDGELVVRARAGGTGSAEPGIAPGTAALARQALRSADPVTLTELPAGDGTGSVVPLALRGVGSAMAARIGDRSEPFGAIVVHSPSPGAFTTDDGSFLTAVANVLAGGLERDRREQEMRQLALHDDLTGLPNRKLLLDRLGYALTRARRDGGSGALALLDLDGFKAINDTLGHHAGDEVLRQVGANLTTALRAGDTVARLGGDEFALLLQEVATREEAARVGQKVLDAVRRPVVLEDREIAMDASVGMALHPLHGDEETLLLRRADAAMYTAKRSGGGYATYAPDQDDFEVQRRGEVADLRHAIEAGELTVDFQPKLRLSNQRVCGLEVLARWRHPERGVIGPSEFIPLAEQAGLIRSLTVRILELALEQVRRWRNEGIDTPVSVNLSGDLLHDPTLIPMLQRSLSAATVPPEALQLEITEGAFMKRPGAAMAVIRDLAAAGIRTSMDDFGTGQSSLAYLERLPLSELKIHRSFVLERRSDAPEATIVDAVIGLAHTFDFAVVGEGIETRETCHALRARGCDIGQGYHLQAPLPPDQMTTWLRRRRFARADQAS